MARRVLIACVDGSLESHEALRVARSLADGLGLELVLLTVAPSPPRPGRPASALAREQMTEAEKLLEQAVDAVELPDTVERRVESGDPTQRVLATCVQEDATMVVLGSRGRGGLRPAPLGSVATGVPAKAPCPVVVVPLGAADQNDARSSVTPSTWTSTSSAPRRVTRIETERRTVSVQKMIQTHPQPMTADREVLARCVGRAAVVRRRARHVALFVTTTKRRTP